MRRTALLIATIAISAAPAHAAPRPLATNPSAAALAGDTVLYAQATKRRLRVFAQPYAGGPRTEVFAFTAAKGPIAFTSLAASPQRAALVVTVDDGSAFGSADVFAGPPAGPWTHVSHPDEETLPFQTQVVADTVFTSELRGDLDHFAVVARDPEPHDVPLPPEDAYTAVFAGPFVAYSQDERIVVQDWRTGAAHSTVRAPDPVDQLALRADGRVAYVTNQHEVYEGGRRLAELAQAVAFAGDRLVYLSGYDLRVIEPDGRTRPFGAPTEGLGGFTTDGTRVLWWANDCLLTADVTERAAGAIDPGPCPRSEVQVSWNSDQKVRRTLSIPVQCIAAPSACRGTMKVRYGPHGAHLAARSVRFSVPAGRTRRVRVTLTDRAYDHVRRAASRKRPASLPVELRTDDGDRSPASLTQTVFVWE
jgi:hypothetical protein